MKRRFFLSLLLKTLKKALTLFFSFLFIRFAFPFVERKPVNMQHPSDKRTISRSVSINDDLLDALILVESSNNPQAHRHSSGARGLTQITPVVWKDLRRHYPVKYRNLSYHRDIYRPDIAREAGRDYLQLLKHYLRAKGIPATLDNLLAAYNWGPENLKRYGIKNAPRETRHYIRKIRSLLEV